MIMLTLIGLVALGALISAFDGDDAAAEAENPSGGTQGDDTLKGTDMADLLVGDAGDDILTGYKGDDMLLGDEGDDLLRGYTGNDSLLGGAGEDLLLGGTGNDSLLGGSGSDTLEGGDGDDALFGVNIYARDIGIEDLIAVAKGNDMDIPFIDPVERGNILDGGAGDDLLIAGPADSMTGGTGDDVFGIGAWVDTEDEAVTIVDFTAGEDRVLIEYQGPIPPVVTIDTNDAEDEQELSLNGVLVARVYNSGLTVGLTPDQVTLRRI